MTQITLSAATQKAINVAVDDEPGTNNINYIRAYNDIYNDIRNTGTNLGTQYWFSQAANVNGQAFNSSAAGTFIWNYTQAAAAAEGYNVTTNNLQIASNDIAKSVFTTLQQQNFVFTDANVSGGFAPQQIVANEAGAGIGYLQSLYPGLDYAVWGGTLFAQTTLNDPTYISDYGINLTPGSTDCHAILSGYFAGMQATVSNFFEYPGIIVQALPGVLSLDGSILSACSGGRSMNQDGVGINQYGELTTQTITTGTGITANVDYTYNSSDQATQTTTTIQNTNSSGPPIEQISVPISNSGTPTGYTVNLFNSGGSIYDSATYNMSSQLQSQVITNSDDSEDVWVFNTGISTINTFVANYNPQGQETWQMDWNSGTATPMTMWQLNTTGSGNWISADVNYSNTMQAQSATVNLLDGDWTETAWNLGNGVASATGAYQSGTGATEWNLIGYSNGNNEYITYDIGNTNPTAWSSVSYFRNDANYVTAMDTVYNNGNQQLVSYNSADPGFSYTYNYQGGSLSSLDIENSDGSSTQITYDLSGGDWQTETETFGASGQITSEATLENDGSIVQTLLDFNQTQTWAAMVNFLTPSDQNSVSVALNDDGTETISTFPSGATTANFAEVLTSTSALQAEEFISGNTTEDLEFNPTGTRPFIEQVNTYDDGQLAIRDTIGSTGTAEQTWDLGGTAGYSEFDQSFNTSGVETFSKEILNNGSFFDIVNLSSNDTVALHFTPTGQFAAGTETYDGTTIPFTAADLAGDAGLIQSDADLIDPYGIDNNGIPGSDFSDLLGGNEDGAQGVGDVTGSGDGGGTDDGGDGGDPIVLNLQHGTVTTTARIDSGVSFDIAGTGTAVATGWIPSGEGFLVFDSTAAPVTSAALMVTSLTVLARYDSNGDGVINATDPAFQALGVWIPGANGQDGTVESLAQLGITSISLSGTTDGQFDHGNQILTSFQFAYANGSTGQAADVSFALGPNPSSSAIPPVPSLPQAVSGSLDIGNTNTVVTIDGSATITGGDGWDTVLGTLDNGDTITLGNGLDAVFLSGNDDSIGLGNGNDVVTLTGNENSISLGNGGNNISLAGSNDNLLVGGGSDVINVGSISDSDSFTLDGANTSLILHGAQNPIVFLNGGSADITGDPGGQDQLVLQVGSLGGSASLADFSPGNVVLDLPSTLGLGTAQQIAAYLNSHPDGTGGSVLDFTGGSLDFHGVAPGSFQASNFHLGAALYG